MTTGAYIGRDADYEEPLAQPSAMWLDLYALTMAQALFFEGRHEQQATFHAFIRKTPFNAAYLVTSGQNRSVRYKGQSTGYYEALGAIHKNDLSGRTRSDPLSGRT